MWSAPEAGETNEEAPDGEKEDAGELDREQGAEQKGEGGMQDGLDRGGDGVHFVEFTIRCENKGMAYPEQFLIPMRQELVQYGVEETRTPEQVDEALKADTVLMVVNSICGCAAGKARPAIGAALKNAKLPAKAATVFAGGDEAATAHLRGILSEYPPSSPAMFLFKQGKPVFALHRRDIETSDAFTLSSRLKAAFDEHC